MHPLLSAARDRYFFLDWDELACSAAAGSALVEAHPGEGELEAGWRTAGRLLERGAVIKTPGAVSWRVVTGAPELSDGAIDALEALGALLDRFGRAVVDAVARSRWLRDALGFPVWPEEQELFPTAAEDLLAFLRIDLVPDESGGFRLVELQTVSGGLGITQALRDVYGPHPRLPGVAAGLDEALTLGYRRHCARVGLRPKRRPLVAVFLDGDSIFRHELLVLASALRAVEMVVGPWVRLRGAGFPCLRDGREPDVLFRFFESAAILPSESSFKRTLLRRVVARELCVQNPWLDVLDDKRLLAVVHHDAAPREVGGALSDEDWRALRALVPPSWRLDAARAAELKGLPRRRRGFYLKKAHSSMSRAIVDGQQENRGRFDLLVDRAVQEGDWIVQQAVRSRPWRFRWLDQQAGEVRESDAFVRLTPIYTRTAAGSMQLADACITARPGRSRVHGASDACLTVPTGR